MSAEVRLCVRDADALLLLPLGAVVPTLLAASPSSVGESVVHSLVDHIRYAGSNVTKYRTVKFLLFAVPAQQ